MPLLGNRSCRAFLHEAARMRSTHAGRQVLAAKALKQQQQQKKQQLREAAVATADAVKQAVLQQQVELIEADEAQEEKIMEKLRRIGRCPAGAQIIQTRLVILVFDP